MLNALFYCDLQEGSIGALKQHSVNPKRGGGLTGVFGLYTIEVVYFA